MWTDTRRQRQQDEESVQKIQQEYKMRGGPEEKGTILGILTNLRESTKIPSVFDKNV